VLFGGGPGLEPGVRRFLCRLEDHPDIQFLGAVCESEGQSLSHVVRDLWRRRRFAAVPLLAARIGADAARLLAPGGGEAEIRRRIRGLAERIRYVSDIHAPEVLDYVRSLDPDLGLVYGSPILQPELFTIPALGTLGIHHGTLPRYRGKKTTFWEMYHGETHAGVTIQRIERGLDAGAIVEQGRVPIGHRSRRRVWSELEALGVDLYVRAILKVRDGTATYVPQAGPGYALCRDPSLRRVIGLWWRQLRARAGRPLPPGPGPAPRPPRGTRKTAPRERLKESS
jgi:folate-dependent phosphoribosylglycinamide formyltransferase PurN